jgi:Tol biopolymer transport system component
MLLMQTIALWSLASALSVQNTDGNYYNSNPTWSSDARVIYFYTNRGPNRQVYQFDLDQNCERHVFETGFHDFYPTISPDDRRLAFVSERNGELDLYELDFASGDISRLTNDGLSVRSPNWSLDGSLIAFDAQPDDSRDIFVFRRSSGEMLRLTQGASHDLMPDWHSGGERLIFQSNRSGTYQIYEMQARPAAEPSVVFHSRTNAYSPTWSPDGSSIGFLLEDEISGVPSIWIYNFDIGESSQLTESPFDSMNALSWSPLGDQIAVMGYVDGLWDIYLVNAVSGEHRKLTRINSDGTASRCE